MERQKPLTPTTITNVTITPSPSTSLVLPTKRNLSRMQRENNSNHACRSINFNVENERQIEIELHSHEASKDYMMRCHERGGNANRERWEDCRLLTKFKNTKSNGREEVLCTVECRIRRDLKETKPWRPVDPIRLFKLIHTLCRSHLFCVYDRYNQIRVKTKFLGGKWTTICAPKRNVSKSILLKRCMVKLSGLGQHECQVHKCCTISRLIH